MNISSLILYNDLHISFFHYNLNDEIVKLKCFENVRDVNRIKKTFEAKLKSL